MSQFGPIFDPSQLEDAMEAHLQKWFRTYAAEISEQRGFGRDQFEEPRFWATSAVLDRDTVPQIRYPAVLIVSPGLSEQPVRRGDGTYEAKYIIGVTVLATAVTEAHSGKMAKRYGAAIRTCVMQKPSLGAPFVESTDWGDERFTDYLAADQQTVSSATEVFNVTVIDIFNARYGPIAPDPLPEPAEYGDNPTVRDFNDEDDPYRPADVDNVTIGEEL